MSEQELRHAAAAEGFDHAEPKVGAIVGFGIGSIILLVITILALQSYFNKIWQEAVYEKVLAPPSEQLLDLHRREDWLLTHYSWADKKNGAVRIPVDRAMELFAQEAASGKLFYPAKSYIPKKDDAAGASGAPGAAPAK
ncbi:MAG TPA: hypothetical protein VKX39_13030 [Bryobacteraceae bacterium]|jgi:hypothetical protein|nr:hypothetical protein [Bryobacteraceae bacterium]